LLEVCHRLFAGEDFKPFDLALSAVGLFDGSVEDTDRSLPDVAAGAVASAVFMITSPNPVKSVLWLIVNFFCIAVTYLILHAQFIAIIQILVYAGGIVVLYLVVVMLVNLKRPPEEHRDPRRQSLLGFGLAAAVLVELAAIAAWGTTSAAPAMADASLATVPVTGNTETVGWLVYTSYLIPFEIASMLLLVAMIGAIVLAKREL